jgi:amidase
MLNLLAIPDETGPGIAHRLALPPARHDDLAGYRILVVDTHPLIPTSEEVRTAINRLASDLAAAGVAVERHSPLLPDQIEAARLYMRLLLAAIAATYPPDVYAQAAAAAQRIGPEDVSLAAERARGAALSHRDWITADALRTKHRAQWGALFTEFDIVLCPAAPIDGTPYDYADQLVWAGIATTPGLPATVAPVARSFGGLPIGVQLIGPLFEDRTPMRFAKLLEQEFGGFQPVPANNPARPHDLCAFGK